MDLKKPPSQMSGEEKYGLLLCVFIAYLMLTTGCTQAEASFKIADLCAKGQCG
jgi:hypothetical protein